MDKMGETKRRKKGKEEKKTERGRRGECKV